MDKDPTNTPLEFTDVMYGRRVIHSVSVSGELEVEIQVDGDPEGSSFVWIDPEDATKLRDWLMEKFPLT